MGGDPITVRVTTTDRNTSLAVPLVPNINTVTGYLPLILDDKRSMAIVANHQASIVVHGRAVPCHGHSSNPGAIMHIRISNADLLGNQISTTGNRHFASSELPNVKMTRLAEIQVPR